jgi:ATPase family associated with various cellular activities (AAA)
MTVPASWAESNSEYLSASLHWLRLRIELCVLPADEDRTAKSAEVDEEPKDAPLRKSTSPKKSVTEATETAARSALLKRVADAEAVMTGIESQMQDPPALTMLGHVLGLSKFAQNVLLLCAASEFDTSIPQLCARAQGDSGRESPTFALALRIFDDPAWDALSPEQALRYWRLIEITQPGSQTLITSLLRADERIANYVKGLNYLDDRLSPYLARLEIPTAAEELPASQLEVADRIAACWRLGLSHGLMPVVQLAGADRTSKQLIASYAAASEGRRLYRMSPDALPTQAADLDLLSRLWQRESALLPMALYIDAHEFDGASPDPHATAVRRFLGRADGLLTLGVREAWASLAPRDTFVFDTTKPTPQEQRAVWSRVLGPKNQAAAGLLSAQFNLNVRDIERGAESAGAGQEPLDNATLEKLWDACSSRLRPLLDTLASRINAKATWDDIVLPREEMALLRQIAAQVRQRSKVYDDWGFGQQMNRGLGITALFAGDAGTGKTMAAEVIANDLRLNLYRIDLSSVVSKYIGETEKNLRQLFDAAEDGGAVLFFDEADALFGKRSEVKDSHDRYANIEVNYLLQRMESYGGLAILATNMRSALDAAFTRRLRFIVSFPFPSGADRRRMWQKAFPKQMPVGSLDYDRLGRLNLTGGAISNAAVNAAFLAAQAETAVSMGAVLAAARQEMIKLERPINETDFRWQDTGEGAA